MTLGSIIGQGATAEIYALDGGLVLKLFRRHIPRALSEREYINSRIIAGCGIRAPAVTEYVEQDGRYGIVFEYIAGTSMMKKMMSPLTLGRYAKMLAALQYDVHQHTPEGLPCYKDLLAENIRRAPLLSADGRQKVLEKLTALPDGTAVCHGDFHPDNIMLAEKGPVIMDWMTAGSGDPAADVARTLLMLTYSELPDGVPRLVKGLFNIVRHAMRNAYFKEYRRLSGMTQADIDTWTVPLAAARLNERRPDREAQRLYQMIVSALNPV